jgi:hypothetical protein
MARQPVMIVCLLALLTPACGGGGGKKETKKPDTDLDVQKPPPPPETAEDREKKRLAAAHLIIPEGSNCLPVALKEPGAPHFEIAAIDSAAVMCAIDTDTSRLLGPVGCWSVAIPGGELTYKPAAPLPGRGFSVLLEGKCARGYCMPDDAKLPGNNIAHITWNVDATKVAVLAGEDVHIFDAATKARESGFSIRGDKGMTSEPRLVHWVGELILVEGKGKGTEAAVWMFKPDGTGVGPIIPMGAKDGKPATTHMGSFAMLDKNRIAIAERGFSTVAIYETDSGKRAKLVRRLPKLPCTLTEQDAYWAEQDVGPKCKEAMDKEFTPLIGADAVAGSKSMLVVLRGARLGELGVLDAKTLAEKKAIKMSWCEVGNGSPPPNG